ncbi:endonuclease-reverse transcriptase [Plakobranchus ocellatus]|uniref:Endonuclease-reverse transcriptase n=1 Tax=Plakobranchus ocellatus TaxID=259542 RepID=A0AAV4CSU9_9GAST|nr:endonuclease-reverse transcriptase [Plakobranchus ocellatus]
MMRISWTEKKSNELVLKEANLGRSLIKTIRQRQLQFLGHICRHKGLEHLAITGKIEGKSSRGRQKITFIENLQSWAIGKGSSNNFIREKVKTSGEFKKRDIEVKRGRQADKVIEQVGWLWKKRRESTEGDSGRGRVGERIASKDRPHPGNSVPFTARMEPHSDNSVLAQQGWSYTLKIAYHSRQGWSRTLTIVFLHGKDMAAL